MTPAEHYATVQELAVEAGALRGNLDAASREKVVALAQLGHLHLELARHAHLAQPMTRACADQWHPEPAVTVYCALDIGHAGEHRSWSGTESW